MAEVVSTDPDARSVTLDDGQTITGDYLVLAAGSQPNFFGTPGAEHTFPLYSLDDAQRLRSRILAVFEDADKDPSLIDRGALNFVIVGAGATGTEVAGALSEMIRDVMPTEYHDLAVQRAKVILVDHGHAVLAPFSPKAHDYAARALQRNGVQLRLGTSVTHVGEGEVGLSDGTTIPTHCVIWGGGLMAAPLAETSGSDRAAAAGSTSSRTSPFSEFPNVYAIGDFANIPTSEGGPFPQLGSVALQAGAVGGEEHPGRHRGQASQGVPLPRQGHHGDDRQERGRRRGRRAPPRAARRHRVQRVAGRPRRPAQRRGRTARGGVRQLGVGLLQQVARVAGARPVRRRAHRLGNTTTREAPDGRALRRHHHRHRCGRGNAGAHARSVGKAHPAARARRLPAAGDGQLEPEGRLRGREVHLEGHLVRRRREAVPAAGPLLRRRRHQAVRRRAVPPAAAGLRGDQARRRRVAGVADVLRRLRAVLHEGGVAVPGPRQRRRGPDRGAAQQGVPVAGRLARAPDRQIFGDLAPAGITRSTRPAASC